MMMQAQGFPLSPTIFSDKQEYLQAVTSGVQGSVIKWAVTTMPNHREAIVSAMGTTSGNLSRLYPKKALNKHQSEEILDILRVINEASNVFGDQDIVMEWFDTPVPALSMERPRDLLDTFVGRSMISDALAKIRFGDFS